MSIKGNLLGYVTLAVAVFAIGCGSAEPVSNAGNTASGRNSSSSNHQVGATVVNANEVNDPNAAIANADSPANKVMQRIEQIRAEAAKKGGDPNAGKITRAGAEDSTITTQLTDFARETRIFHKNPLLMSVEKVHDGKEGVVYITLRKTPGGNEGRQITLKGDAVMNIETVTAAQLLQLAGVSEVLPGASTSDPRKKASN